MYESFVKVAVKFLLSTKMLLVKSIPVIRNAYPLVSDSSIRRLERQNILPQRCRNQATVLDGPNVSQVGVRSFSFFKLRKHWRY
jgi:hypothetical protein